MKQNGLAKVQKRVIKLRKNRKVQNSVTDKNVTKKENVNETNK